MHISAMNNGKMFFDVYCKKTPGLRIMEVGSQLVNGGLRDIFQPNNIFTGIDCIPGKGVDVVLENPYKFPFESNTFDIVLCSSMFEHCEFFWVTFLEVMRVLKPHGLFYCNAPSNGPFHRFPVDCWRFYPDSGRALARWGNINGYNCKNLESYISGQEQGMIWKDFVSVWIKDQNLSSRYQKRILYTFRNFTNGLINNSDYLNLDYV